MKTGVDYGSNFGNAMRAKQRPVADSFTGRTPKNNQFQLFGEKNSTVFYDQITESLDCKLSTKLNSPVIVAGVPRMRLSIKNSFAKGSKRQSLAPHYQGYSTIKEVSSSNSIILGLGNIAENRMSIHGTLGNTLPPLVRGTRKSNTDKPICNKRFSSGYTLKSPATYMDSSPRGNIGSERRLDSSRQFRAMKSMTMNPSSGKSSELVEVLFLTLIQRPIKEKLIDGHVRLTQSLGELFTARCLEIIIFDDDVVKNIYNTSKTGDQYYTKAYLNKHVYNFAYKPRYSDSALTVPTVKKLEDQIEWYKSLR
jgi:hypothetical protein